MRHPCVGDLTYGADPVLAARLGLTRQWLHAVRLVVEHPGTGERLEVGLGLPGGPRARAGRAARHVSAVRVEVAGTAAALAAVYDLRRRVFVDEQRVPAELERDDLDATAEHLLAMVDGRPAGTVRLVVETAGPFFGLAHLGRLAVLPAYRGTGLGVLLTRAVERRARERGLRQVVLTAQVDALSTSTRASATSPRARCSTTPASRTASCAGPCSRPLRPPPPSRRPAPRRPPPAPAARLRPPRPAPPRPPPPIMGRCGAGERANVRRSEAGPGEPRTPTDVATPVAAQTSVDP